jgi:hypothetical protein
MSFASLQIGYIATKHLVWATLAVPQWLLYFL